MNTNTKNILVALLILIIENIVIFHNHYLGRSLFPWDFSQGYYAVTSFWTSGLSQRLFPEWVPFQSMGYPLAMNLQSGIYYPILWLFPVLGIPYTLSAAVSLQCLHVLFGAVGMFFLLTDRLRSLAVALLGAAAFQLFGGFYSNSEHVDIIRAFSLTPWLFYVLSFRTICEEQGSPHFRSFLATLPCRALFIPLFVYMLATGGYPGNFLSCMFMLALYVLLQLAKQYMETKSFRAPVASAVSVMVFTSLGLAMAVVHLGPAWVEKSNLTREQSSAAMNKMGLWFQHLPTLFLSNSSLPDEISMTSTYVTLPVMILLFFLPLRKLKEYWIELSLTVLTVFMVAGPRSPVFKIVVHLLPPLNYSRFPSSDYRIFIGLFVIMFGCVAFESICKEKMSRRKIAFRMLVALSVVSCGYLYFNKIDPTLSASLNPLLALGAIALMTVILIGYLAQDEHPLGPYVLIVLALIFVDGFRVLPDMNLHRPDGAIISTWRDDDVTSDYKGFGYANSTNGDLPIVDVLKRPPASRPMRVRPPRSFIWGGYVTGEYMVSDCGGTKLTALEKIESNSKLEEFMTRQWTPVFLSVDPDSSMRSAPLLPGERVDQVYYGVNLIEYEVELLSPRIMIENEMFFNGWTAKLVGPRTDALISAKKAEDALRSWLLPAGKYTMQARFSFPHLWTYRAISLISLILWLLIVISTVRNKSRKFQATEVA